MGLAFRLPEFLMSVEQVNKIGQKKGGIDLAHFGFFWCKYFLDHCINWLIIFLDILLMA